MKIQFSVDHDTGWPHKAFLIGDYKGQRFVESFKTNSWFNWSLFFAKRRIVKKYQIIYGKPKDFRGPFSTLMEEERKLTRDSIALKRKSYESR